MDALVKFASKGLAPPNSLRLGAVNYAKESNLGINNDNLAKERLYYYNLYAKNYYFRNALSLF
jgi:hypothetical protein